MAILPVHPRTAVHFVGFRDDRYWNAVRIWGEPDFIHETWDSYARDDMTPQDLVIFANGEWDRPPRSFSSPPAAGAGTGSAKGR